jgi:GT2 family glycosyltransferase
MESPLVYLIIPNWNGKSLLNNCLSSLFDATTYENFEVIVVDNGSEDGSVEMVLSNFPEVHLIQNSSNRGFATANNQGFERALSEGADYAMMLNNDTEITDPGWLGTLVSIAEDIDDLGILGCRVRTPDGQVHYDGRYFPMSSMAFPHLADKFAYNRLEQYNRDDRFEYVDQVVGAAFLVKRELLETVGLLDEAYHPIYHEESDYCVRTWNAGYTAAYTPETELLHVRKESSSKLDTNYKRYIEHRNKFRFVLINYPASWLLIGIPMLLALTAQFFLNRSSDNEYSISEEFRSQPLRTTMFAFRTYLDLVFQMGDILEKRRQRDDIKKLVK